MGFPVWWDRSRFLDKYRDRQVDLGHLAYVDYAVLLTQWEALAWDKQCRENFSADPRCKMPDVMLDMQRLESSLKEARWVVVESYEWESGMD